MRKIEKFVNQNKINFIDVVFLDLYGTTRQITIPTNKLADALDYGLKCDGSSVNYSNKIEDSDTRLILDETSYFLLPDNKLMVFCFTDNQYDARKNLLNIQTDLSQNNTKINFGAELEFFLFKQANGQVDLNNSDNLKYFNQITGDYSNCLNDICNFCSDKINLEALHHECGRNQFEIDWKYDTPLKTADNIVYLKRVIRFFAEKYGFRACFMPKPLNDVSGSGMHLNISIFKGEQNLFYDKNDINNLSKFAYKFVKNIFKHISAITAFANPLVNSYKRLNTGFETPTQVNYSSTNRSALVRIPKASPKTTRIELRSPDVACNPYLCFASILLAGFNNDKTIKPPSKLPENLHQSIKCLSEDKLINKLVPENYISKKILEATEFDIFVSNFDIEKYFDI